MTARSVNSEIVIDENLCWGCGYCVSFCPKNCLEMTGNRINKMGYTIPVATSPENCNFCGNCVEMCPHWAIEIYHSVDVTKKNKNRNKVAGPPKLAPSAPLVSCRGCQHPTVGRIIAQVIDELRLDDQFVALDAAGCGGSSTFDLNFGRIITVDEDPIAEGVKTKKAYPDKLVFVVQNEINCISTGLESLIKSLACADMITLIMCNESNYGTNGGRIEPIIPIKTSNRRDFILGRYPIPLAEMVAQFQGVSYCARSAITSLKDYRRTKKYIKNAFQNQLNSSGFGFVEILCGCSPEFGVIDPLECLDWIREKMVLAFPLGEFKKAH
ncbi:MAG: 4Fe-4S binding protein [Deltaproteobacteria bacterium]|nr:4Fe-4S binding protein [Deltaproteobacteria bacterium]